MMVFILCIGTHVDTILIVCRIFMMKIVSIDGRGKLS